MRAESIPGFKISFTKLALLEIEARMKSRCLRLKDLTDAVIELSSVE